MTEEHWQWQEPGTAWRGIGIYHITLTVPSRQPLLGKLVIPDNDPSQARVERTALGNAVIDELYVMCKHYPAIRIFQFCLMPDHLHAVIQVTRVMDTSIRSVIRGYWQGVKKLGRAYTLAVSSELNSETTNKGETTNKVKATNQEATNKETASQDTTNKGGATNQGTTDQGSDSWAFPIFTERPFIRPLSRKGQLRAMMHYVQMNPQRLATKRMMPGFFRVQKGIEIAGRSYDGVGNVALLHARQYDVVHVRSIWVKAAERGDSQQLRDYMNSCVLKARKGVVMVSPFISPDEKRVQNVLLEEKLSFILLADNGFRDYYKPTDALFDACAEGRVLILSPWQYDADKRHITRNDCVALNEMAESFLQY
jgi:hypothetical protein